MDNVSPPATSGNVVLWFGRHKCKPLAEIPADYLRWVLREVKLSSGVRQAVADELSRRGVQVPPPPRVPDPWCDRHPSAGYVCGWREDRLGRRSIRASCATCGRALTTLPAIAPYTDEADAAASPTAILDTLTRLADLGVELVSDGRSVSFARHEDWRRVPADLHAILRQCRHTLARMLGRTREAS